MVVLGGEFISLLFIGVMAAGCWSELRSGCFWEVYNGDILLPRGWLLIRRVVNIGFTILLLQKLLWLVKSVSHFFLPISKTHSWLTAPPIT